MSDIASEVLRVQEKLSSDRSVFESHWAEIAPLILDRQDNFWGQNKPDGERRDQRKFDDTAGMALQRFAAAKEAVRTPRGSKWHKLSNSIPELQENKEVQEWNDKATDFLFKMRNRAKANYANQQHECYISDGAFGTSVLIVEDEVGYGARYKSSHIAEHYFMENANGIIDVDYRRFKLTARQAMQKFGYDNLPEQIQTAYHKDASKKFEFVHCVTPDDDREFISDGWKSYYVSVTGKRLVASGFFKKFPFIIDRHLTSPNEVYGRSPAMMALAEIKTLNSMRKTDLKARHLAVDPINLAADQATIRRFVGKPGAINYGTLDAAGNPLIKPFNSGVRIDLSNDGIEQSRKFINDMFFVTLFQILVDNPAMTATEVLQRAQEKQQMIAPVMTQDSLARMIEIEMSIYEDYGIFGDGEYLEMPRIMKEYDGEYQIEFTSPLARMQKGEEALATERTIQSLLPLAQIDPTILKRVNWDEYADIMREANGAPAKLFKSKDQMEAEEQAEQQQMAMQQMVQAAPQMAGAIKDIAQAQSYQQ